MTIKEVEQYLEVPRATVRFYEKEGLIHPQRGENGYREYSDEDVQNLKKIIILRKLGLSVADIEDVLDGARPMCEVVADNINNLEKQIENLQGALVVCRKLQEEQEEITTFDVEKYWNVIEEEEQKGNRFLDIAKDVAHFEKGIILEYFGIADREGNLSVSIPKAILTVILCIVLFVVVSCIIEGAWTWHNVLGGIKNISWIILLEIIVGIPIFFVGRKRPEVLKKKNKIMFWVFLGLFVLCIVILFLCTAFGWE